MTPERLAEIKKAAEAATPGPWTAKATDYDPTRCAGIYHGESEWDEIVTTDSGVYGPEMRDAEFIALARTAVPELLAEIERLRAIVRGELRHTVEIVGEP